MPRVKSKRNKCKHCKTIGCLFFTTDTHCSGCKIGLVQKRRMFERALKKQVNALTEGSKDAIGETVMQTISNLMKKDTFLKAEDVLKFCNGSYQGFLMGDVLLDRLLMRVVDYWNIQRDKGFNPTIHCYWNPYDHPRGIMAKLYRDRKKLFTRREHVPVLPQKLASQLISISNQFLH